MDRQTCFTFFSNFIKQGLFYLKYCHISKGTDSSIIFCQTDVVFLEFYSVLLNITYSPLITEPPKSEFCQCPWSEILGLELQISKVQVAYLWDLKPSSNFEGPKREKGWGTDPADKFDWCEKGNTQIPCKVAQDEGSEGSRTQIALDIDCMLLPPPTHTQVIC